MRRTLVWPALVLGALLTSLPAEASGPFYVSGAIANASTDLDVSAEFQRLISDEDEGWSLGVGFHISRHLAIEGVYHDFGTAREDTICTPDVLCTALVAPAKADSSAVTISILPHWPLSENVFLYGRLGIASWDSDVSEAFSDFKLASVDDEELVYGAGIRFAIAGPIGAFAEIARVADTFETISVGATWGF